MSKLDEMAKADAMAAAAALDREAADLAAQSRAKLAEARAVRAPHCNWLEREAHAASAEVACWSSEKRAEYRQAAGQTGGEVGNGPA